MKHIRHWLLPAVTCLVVLTAALLPRQLSLLRDKALLGTVHGEALTADNNLPLRPLGLTERIELLSYWMDSLEDLSVVSRPQSEESTPEAPLEETVRKELENLTESGVLPWEVFPEDLSGLDGTRLYLRKIGYLSGAGFLQFSLFDKQKNRSLWMMLDEETGHVLWLELFCPGLRKYSAAPADIGRVFLDRLGIENQLTGSGDRDAVYLLTGTQLLYAVSMENDFLSVHPLADLGGMGSNSAVYDG